MMKLAIKKSEIFYLLFALTSVASILVHTSLDFNVTYFWWSVDFVLLLLMLHLKRIYYNPENNMKLIWPVLFFLIWNGISMIRGGFAAEYYWDWKQLIANGMVLFIPLSIYIFTNPVFVQNLIRFWLKYALFAFFVLIPFIVYSDVYGRYLAPVLLLLLILPILPRRWQIITLIFTFLVLTAGFDARSNVLRFMAAMALGMVFYFRWFIKEWAMKTLHTVFMILPAILLVLAMTNTFNIFKMDEYIKGDYTVESTLYGESTTEKLTSDTRTFLYIEVIESAIKNHYVLLGRTPARGYNSLYFGDTTAYDLGTDRMERYSSEVAIHNIFTWTGVIGVILYFLVFFRASFLAVYRSNNHFIKVIGLFVAFRWMYAFVEDFTTFDINYLVIWVLIGMCYSAGFRTMTNDQFKKWVKEMLPYYNVKFKI